MITCLESKASLSVPLSLIKVVANILPQDISSKFDENGDKLEALVNALKDTKMKGVLLEVEDKADNERAYNKCVQEWLYTLACFALLKFSKRMSHLNGRYVSDDL